MPFLLKNLGEGDLLLMDCGLTSFKNMQLCLRREVSFVFRFHSGWKPTVVEVLSEGDYIAKFKPSGKAKDEFGPEPLLLRVLEFRVGENEKVRLVTDLKDHKAFPAIELARLYRHRWESELLFKEKKVNYW